MNLDPTPGYRAQSTMGDRSTRRGGSGARAPLVPPPPIAGRSLVIVIAIMTFLAALAAGAALLVADASVEWRGEVAREATVQVRPVPGRDIEADLRRPPS